MVAVEHLVRFYVDESAAGLGLALAAARKDTIHCGHTLIPECPRRADDIVSIPAVAARGLVVIARDKKLRTKPVEVRAPGSTGCGCSASAASATCRRGNGSPAWCGTGRAWRSSSPSAGRARGYTCSPRTPSTSSCRSGPPASSEPVTACVSVAHRLQRRAARPDRAVHHRGAGQLTGPRAPGLLGFCAPAPAGLLGPHVFLSGPATLVSRPPSSGAPSVPRTAHARGRDRSGTTHPREPPRALRSRSRRRQSPLQLGHHQLLRRLVDRAGRLPCSACHRTSPAPTPSTCTAGRAARRLLPPSGSSPPAGGPAEAGPAPRTSPERGKRRPGHETVLTAPERDAGPRSAPPRVHFGRRSPPPPPVVGAAVPRWNTHASAQRAPLAAHCRCQADAPAGGEPWVAPPPRAETKG